MKSFIQIYRVLSLVLVAFFAGSSLAAPVARAEWPQERSWTPNRRPSWPAGPKVLRAANPNWYYEDDEYTNPCFIAPGAYRTPLNSYARPSPAFLDELFFELTFEAVGE